MKYQVLVYTGRAFLCFREPTVLTAFFLFKKASVEANVNANALGVGKKNAMKIYIRKGITNERHDFAVRDVFSHFFCHFIAELEL